MIEKISSFSSVYDAINSNLGPGRATPLLWAVRPGHIQMVTFLIRKGADVLAVDEYGCTSLHYAAQSGNILMVLYLLAHLCTLADDQCFKAVNAVDRNGQTPLMFALNSKNDTAPLISKYLLQAGADINQKDYSGLSAIHWAAVISSRKALEFLILNGCDINQKTGLNKIDNQAGIQPGKTALDILKERETSDHWFNDIFREPASFKPPEDKSKRYLPYSYSFALLLCALISFCYLPWFYALPLCLVFSATYFLLIIRLTNIVIHSSLLHTGMLQSTIFYSYLFLFVEVIPGKETPI